MNDTDLLLLHAPSVYDFRERSILYGPVSDMVPSSTVFEMYPIGFLTMLSYLEARGLAVRIVNLAVRMMKDRHFHVPGFLAGLRPPKAIGIDLHWLPHAHGALEVARIAKEAHPDVPVIMGGLSATYYHRELIGYPQVDYVLRGDCTEPPLHQLLMALRSGASLSAIPNLTWKDAQGVHVNPLTFIPQSLDYVDVRPELLVDMVMRYRDVEGVLPFGDWLHNPATMVLPVKGCAYDCVTCGSSRTTCTHLTQRTHPVFRSPHDLVQNMRSISHFSRAPIIVPGDLLQGGLAYALEVMRLLREAQLPNETVFELFDLPPPGYLQEIDRSVPSWSFEISPESHEHAIRIAMDGEPDYDNAQLEAFLREALTLRCHRIDVFFMIGLPQQTPESVRDMVDYCGRLLAMSDRRLSCFISPMGPFVDPGSRIFEEPERFGYRLFARTLEEHRQLLVQPSWQHILNYETRWMSRAQLVDATYDAAERLNELKRQSGRISARQAREVARRIAEARRLKGLLEQPQAQDAEAQLTGDISRFSLSTVCDKSELLWPRHLINFRPLGILRAALAARTP